MRQMRWISVVSIVSIFLVFPCLSLGQSSQSLWTKSIHADTSGNVTFQVNMHIKMLEGTFLPGSNDSVWVRGNFNNWGTTLARRRLRR